MNRSKGPSIVRTTSCLLLVLALAAALPVLSAAQAVTGTLLGTVPIPRVPSSLERKSPSPTSALD